MVFSSRSVTFSEVLDESCCCRSCSGLTMAMELLVAHDSIAGSSAEWFVVASVLGSGSETGVCVTYATKTPTNISAAAAMYKGCLLFVNKGGYLRLRLWIIRLSSLCDGSGITCILAFVS